MKKDGVYRLAMEAINWKHAQRSLFSVLAMHVFDDLYERAGEGKIDDEEFTRLFTARIGALAMYTMLVGPGAITTTIFNLQTYGVVVTALSVFAVLTLTWLILRYVTSVYRFLGKTGALVIARVMTLLIAAIAIQYVLFDVTDFLESMS